MPTFSVTAPSISPEQEKAELQSLTEEERRRLHNDMYGCPDQQEEQTVSDEMKERSVQLFYEAIASIPRTEKTDYLEALDRVLEMEKECPPLLFLQCEEFDAWKAARRMVEWWKVRKTVFGPERCFLPMTKGGAMSGYNDCLRKALVLPLPEDKYGRSVWFLDRIRCVPSEAPRDAILRCMWYTLHSLLEREDAAAKGLVILVNVQGFDLYTHFDRGLLKLVLKIFGVVPMRIRAFHMCTGSGRSAIDVVMPVLKHMLGKEIRTKLCLHAGSLSEIVASFHDFGLSQTHAQVVYENPPDRERRAAEWLHQREQMDVK